MTQTEKKHWQNGYQIRGGWHKTYALSIGSIGIILCNCRPFISIYKLT